VFDRAVENMGFDLKNIMDFDDEQVKKYGSTGQDSSQ
jgi:hypothetical protein